MGDSSSRKSNCLQFLVYAQCYFLTIAQILGTGVLGLPVTLAQSGFTPFLITFLITFLIQVLLIVFMTDLLQKAVAVQIEYPRSQSALVGETSDLTPLTRSFSEVEYAIGDDAEKEPCLNASDLTGDELLDSNVVRQPDLHLLAELFLPRWLIYPYDIIFTLGSVALLVSYALAGGQAWVDLINGRLAVALPVFCWVLTLLICFAQKLVMPVVSIFTFFKGALLSLTVIIAFIVGSHIHEDITNNFTYTASPLLMGTVALGAVPLVMPYMYTRISQVKNQVLYFRMSCILGLLTCCLLNIGWCWAILEVVPQTTAECINSIAQTAKSISNSSVCVHPNISLALAKARGEISTVPFKAVIDSEYPQYEWVAVLVTLFIVISITVSFIINGSVLVHTVDGWIESHWPKDRWRCCDYKWLTTQTIAKKITALILLGIVFLIAMLNPQGFEKVLEKAVSIFLNLLAGVFFFTMIAKTSTEKYRSLNIPLPLSSVAVHFQYLIVVYFNLAVLYDAVTWIMELSGVHHY